MENLKIKLFSNFVVLDIIKPGTTAGGIVIPETSKQTQLKGVVIAVSKMEMEGKPLIQITKVGDVVLFDEFAAKVIIVNDKQYILLRETDLFCILNAEEPLVN